MAVQIIRLKIWNTSKWSVRLLIRSAMQCAIFNLISKNVKSRQKTRYLARFIFVRFYFIVIRRNIRLDRWNHPFELIEMLQCQQHTQYTWNIHNTQWKRRLSAFLIAECDMNIEIFSLAGVINDLFIVLNTQKRTPLFLSFAELMSRDKRFHRFLLAKFNHPTDLLQLLLPFSM